MQENFECSAEVLEENNFYPFGLKHEGYNAQARNPSYNYQYNGKELQKETGWSDYGARMYMADIGRWGVLDPLAESTTRVSPYNYALNNPVMFVDPDGRKAYNPEPVTSDIPRGGLLDFFGSGGYTQWGSYEEFIGKDVFGYSKKGSEGVYGGGNTTLVNIIINFLRGDKEHLGSFVNSDFEANGWHVIDASSLADALMKLTKYLGNNQADNIYINAHGLVSERYTFDENGDVIRDQSTGKYVMVGDTGFYTNIDTEKILGSDIQQYISDKSKLSSDKLNSINSFIGIVNYVKSGKNLIMGSCWSVRYDDLFGTGISSIVKSRDIFINRDYSSLWPNGGKIGFESFIKYNQTSQDKYINGWVWYKDGSAIQRNFNIIMTKYGVKTIKYNKGILALFKQSIENKKKSIYDIRLHTGSAGNYMFIPSMIILDKDFNYEYLLKYYYMPLPPPKSDIYTSGIKIQDNNNRCNIIEIDIKGNILNENIDDILSNTLTMSKDKTTKSCDPIVYDIDLKNFFPKKIDKNGPVYYKK